MHVFTIQLMVSVCVENPLTLCVRSSHIRDRRNLTRAYDGHESVTHRVRQENTAVMNS